MKQQSSSPNDTTVHVGKPCLRYAAKNMNLDQNTHTQWEWQLRPSIVSTRCAINIFMDMRPSALLMLQQRLHSVSSRNILSYIYNRPPYLSESDQQTNHRSLRERVLLLASRPSDNRGDEFLYFHSHPKGGIGTSRMVL